MKQRIVIDCAGAAVGGAARFLRELREYLDREQNCNITLIGLGRQLSPQWLVWREVWAAAARKRISLNNVGFLNPLGSNITLLRNILQFASDGDFERLSFVPSPRLRAQIPVVRTFAKASRTLVAPCSRMAEQVTEVKPRLRDKLVVRFHPITQPAWAGSMPNNPRNVLLPVVPSSYKNLDKHIPEFLSASQDIPGDPIRLIVPSTPEVLPTLAPNPRIHFIGPQTSESLEIWWRECGAIYFPTAFESFGYPLAEGRVYGRHVIAQDTAQNYEIAGDALCRYTRYDSQSLRTAIETAILNVPSPDPDPFNPEEYFQWLIHETE